MIKNSFTVLWMAILWLATSCTKENTEECSTGLRLSFDYSLHTDAPGNRFGVDVEHVCVYLFNEAGTLCAMQQGQGVELTNDYTMNINLIPGKYTILAWGGSNENFNNSFHEGQLNNSATPYYTKGVTIGTTSLNDFLIIINNVSADNNPEDVTPTINQFDDLYYGAVGTRSANSSDYRLEQVEIKKGKLVERKIDMICNTNIIKVTVSGIEHLGSELLNVWVSGRNGRYSYNNTIGEHTRMVRYQPQSQSIEGGKMEIEVKTLRLDKLQHIVEPIYLTIENPVTGEHYPSQPIDVVNTLLQARNSDTGEYIYKTQEDFDRIYEHPIEVTIGNDLSVKVFVHGWEIVELTPKSHN